MENKQYKNFNNSNLNLNLNFNLNSNTNSNKNKFTPLNLFVIDSQKDIFTKEINSLLPNSILLKEESEENLKNFNIHTSKYFFEITENIYNIINLIHLNPKSNSNCTTFKFPLQQNLIFSLNKNFPPQNNLFLFKIPEYFNSYSDIINFFF